MARAPIKTGSSTFKQFKQLFIIVKQFKQQEWERWQARERGWLRVYRKEEYP